ncbi:hypothetical protein TNCV_4543981 [Trichonephila clavipes]|nr:hypothetical protein TNCV_4543981 [Trichonephila clavipes]
MSKITKSVTSSPRIASECGVYKQGTNQTIFLYTQVIAEFDRQTQRGDKINFSIYGSQITIPTVAFAPRSPDLSPLDFFFWVHLKSLAYETTMATVEDLTAGVIIALADIASPLDLFERVRQSFVCRCSVSTMTYAAATSNDSFDSHLPLHL